MHKTIFALALASASWGAAITGAGSDVNNSGFGLWSFHVVGVGTDLNISGPGDSCWGNYLTGFLVTCAIVRASGEFGHLVGTVDNQTVDGYAPITDPSLLNISSSPFFAIAAGPITQPFTLTYTVPVFALRPIALCCNSQIGTLSVLGSGFAMATATAIDSGPVLYVPTVNYSLTSGTATYATVSAVPEASLSGAVGITVLIALYRVKKSNFL